MPTCGPQVADLIIIESAYMISWAIGLEWVKLTFALLCERSFGESVWPAINAMKSPNSLKFLFFLFMLWTGL